MTKKEILPTREEAMQICTDKLKSILDAMIVIDQNTKTEIRYQYGLTNQRLSNMKITEKNWYGIPPHELWQEYEELEKQLKYLEIFSDKFFRILYMRWYDLIQIYNPYTKFKIKK